MHPLIIFELFLNETLIKYIQKVNMQLFLHWVHTTHINFTIYGMQSDYRILQDVCTADNTFSLQKL